MKLFIGNDHAGVAKKKQLLTFLTELKYDVVDLGSQDKTKNDDYVDFAKAVSKQIIASKGRAKGILLCGTGTGMAMAANRMKGIRAGLCYDIYTAKMARYDNNANILCLRTRKDTFESLKPIIITWLKTKFSQKARHKRRIEKLDEVAR